MELEETATHPAHPDAYWAAGDGAYQLLEPLGPKRLARMRANINYNLLAHRRLILADSSILVNPAIFSLLTDEHYGPGYRQLFRDGLIVAAMRASANNYSEVAETIIEKRHFVAEMKEERIRESAKLLDSLRPEIVRTDTREKMREIGGRYLLIPEYWIALGLPENTAIEMIEVVSRQISDRKLETVRQTEFWEYAHNRFMRSGDAQEAIQAQKIRSHMTIASLGLMAKNIGVPPIYPAVYGPSIERIYGTRAPWKVSADGRIKLLNPFEEKEPRRLEEERSIHEIAALLDAEQIIKIRGGRDHQRLLKEIEEAGQKQGGSAALLLQGALEEFRGCLEVDAGKFLTNWDNYKSGWIWSTNKGQLTRIPIPGAIGTVISRANEAFHTLPDPGHLLGYGGGVTVATAITLFSWHKAKKAKSEKRDFKEATREILNDPTVIPELRTDGCIEMSLFGTIPHTFDDLADDEE